ncbi:MAG: glycosyltransferase family 4 protein [candidate division WOR-3 bacterium]
MSRNTIKILVINWQDWKHPLAGGAEVHLREVFKRLANHWEIHVLSCSFKGAKDYEFLEGIHIHRIGERNTFNYWVPFKYRQLEREIGFDLVIEDLNKIPFYTKLYSNKPKLVILHHLFGKSIFEETNPIFALYVLFHENLIPKFYKGIPFVVVSESTKEELVRVGIPERDVKIIYNGIDVEFFKPGEKARDPRVVYLNRIRKYKRPDLALKVFDTVRKHISDTEFFVVGDGPYLNRIKAMAKKLSLNIKFTGFVDEKTKRDILSSAWVVVNTSAKEGWGLVNMESFACGTPVVGFKVPGVKDSVKDGFNGFLVDYGDVKGMAERVVQILRDGTLRESLSQNARKFAEKFTWDRTAEEFKGVISEIISKRPFPSTL